MTIGEDDFDAGDTAPPEGTSLKMSECIQGTAPGAEVGPSTILLRHPGDTVVLVCPPTMSQVSFHTSKVTTGRFTLLGQKLGDSETNIEKENVTLTTGQTKSYGPVKEQTTEGNTFIDNMDYTITLTGALDLSGNPPKLDPDPITYTWEIVLDGEILATGNDTDKKAADDAMTAAGKAFQDKPFSYSIRDGAGNVVKSGVHKPEVADFPWWIVGVGVTLAVIAVIILWMYRRGSLTGIAHPAPAAVPAAVPAAAPAPAQITVVK